MICGSFSDLFLKCLATRLTCILQSQKSQKYGKTRCSALKTTCSHDHQRYTKLRRSAIEGAQKQHRNHNSKRVCFCYDFGWIFDPQINKKSMENPSGSGCNIGAHLGIVFSGFWSGLGSQLEPYGAPEVHPLLEKCSHGRARASIKPCLVPR